MQQGGKTLKPKTKTNTAVDFNRILKENHSWESPGVVPSAYVDFNRILKEYVDSVRGRGQGGH